MSTIIHMLVTAGHTVKRKKKALAMALEHMRTVTPGKASSCFTASTAPPMGSMEAK